MSSAGEEADQNVGTKAAFLTMMVRHGPTLQVLKLWNLLSFADVQALRQHCLDLREVHVRLQPTGHDVDDKILRLLGSLPRIGTIKLTLYNPYPSDEDNNNNISHQRLSLALTNRAMDLPRAQSIFKIILAANRAARPGIVPSLHCLRLHSVGDGQPWNNAERLLDWVGRSWMLERKFADVDSEDEYAKEIGTHERLQLKEELYDVDDNIRYAWDETWPEGRGKQDWMEAWHSFL